MKLVLYNPRAQRAHRRLPLSLLMLGRVLEDWELVDQNVEAGAEARLEALCTGETTLLVTVMPGPQLRAATPLLRRLRARNPRLRIIWGGYFPTVHPAAAAREADWIVIGQGERSLPELLAALAAGRDGLEVPGVAAWREGALRKAPPRPNHRSSDFGPVPYEKVDMERYAAHTFLGRRTYSHHSSVGCPYFCNFCAVVNMFEGRWIPDPAEDVVAHVRRLATDYRADAVEFHDNNFFAWEKRATEVAAGIGGRVRWWGEGRIDTMLGFSGASWEAMAGAGLAMVFFGAESGDDATLEAMDKGGLRVADIRAMNRLCARHGVQPEFSFVLGNAVDAERDVQRSLALVRELKAENPACEIILYLYTPVPLPGQWDKAAALGFRFPETVDEWLAPPWTGFDGRRQASTPWMSEALVRRIYDFEAVLHAAYPSSSDRNLRPWQRALLRGLGQLRWRAGRYGRPVELRLLQRAWGYRRPEEMGF